MWRTERLRRFQKSFWIPINYQWTITCKGAITTCGGGTKIEISILFSLLIIYISLFYFILFVYYYCYFIVIFILLTFSFFFLTFAGNCRPHPHGRTTLPTAHLGFQMLLHSLADNHHPWFPTFDICTTSAGSEMENPMCIPNHSSSSYTKQKLHFSLSRGFLSLPLYFSVSLCKHESFLTPLQHYIIPVFPSLFSQIITNPLYPF